MVQRIYDFIRNAKGRLNSKGNINKDYEETKQMLETINATLDKKLDEQRAEIERLSEEKRKSEEQNSKLKYDIESLKLSADDTEKYQLKDKLDAALKVNQELTRANNKFRSEIKQHGDLTKRAKLIEAERIELEEDKLTVSEYAKLVDEIDILRTENNKLKNKNSKLQYTIEELKTKLKYDDAYTEFLKKLESS